MVQGPSRSEHTGPDSRTMFPCQRGWAMKWMVPINQLDATQERAISDIVDNVRDDHLVSGFAGSGKTIVLTLEFPRFVMQGLGDHPTRTAYSPDRRAASIRHLS